jgi:flagellar capping protein FliD
MGANSNAMLGLSGLDSPAMLKSMMRPYKTQISALSQRQQTVIWKQERYRELIGKLNNFKAKFFDYRNPATNISSAGTWKKFVVDNPGGEFVKITSTADSKPKSGSIEMLQMPDSSVITGRSGLAREVSGSTKPYWDTAVGSYLTINMDGIERSVYITSEIASQPTAAGKVAMLQNAIDSVFGADMIYVDLVPGPPVPGDDVLRFTANPANVNQFIIKDGSAGTARIELGFGGDSNLSNKIVLNDTLGMMSLRMNDKIHFVNESFYENGLPVTREVVKFTINNMSFRFTRFDSIGAVMNAINSSGCGVTMSYDNIGDCFKITSNISGPGASIRIREEETGFFSALGIGFMNEDTASLGVNLVGGIVDPGLLAAINAANSGGPPFLYSFDVTINGVAKSIVLTQIYAGAGDVISDVNDQLNMLFPTAGVSAGIRPSTASPGDFELVLNIDKTAQNAAWSIQIEAGPSMPAGAMDDFGLSAIRDKLLSISPSYEQGKFGRVVIDGVMLQVDRPVFETGGVLYELKKLPPPGSGPIAYTVSADADKIVDMVREFVEAYNDLTRAINAALSEKREKDYRPLTDEQKDQMSEKEIEKWELKAKAGLLRGDSGFIGLSSKLRLTAFSPVYEKYGENKAIPFSLKKMGIDTKDEMSGLYNPADGGTLYIDESALRRAIEANLDQIALLFTRTPEKIEPGPDDANRPPEWKARMQRMYDDYTGGISTKLLNVLDDYVRTMRGTNNSKGLLIERAGIERDSSDLYNSFTKEIIEYERRINALWDRYDRIEKQKIKALSRLESIISNASAQMEWMQGQMGQQR